MSMPLVSIVIPVYNQRKKFLEEAIGSAVGQTYPNLEIIICNNHSTSNECNDTINAYVAQDNRIKVVSPPTFVPIAANFNYGVSASSGEYTVILCSDDILKPGFITDAMETLEKVKEPVAFLYSYSAFFDSDSGKITGYVHKRENRYYSPREALPMFMTGREGSLGGTIYKKEFYEKNGGMNEHLTFTGDTYLFNFILRDGGCVFIDRTYYLIRNWDRPEQVNRLAKNIHDVQVLYDDILNDSKLMSLTDNNKEIVERNRKIRLLGFVYPLQQLHHYPEKDLQVEQEATRLLSDAFAGTPWIRIMIRNINNLIGKVLFKICYKFVIKEGQ
ncbi:glycosyltransferase family 2 protein [Chitinophagaceae bacterium MMS25-I14]